MLISQQNQHNSSVLQSWLETQLVIYLFSRTPVKSCTAMIPKIRKIKAHKTITSPSWGRDPIMV